MASVRARVWAGAGAWAVGAATATGLSLAAVAHLGTGPRNPQGSTLSASQVRQALAAAAAATATSPATPEPASTVGGSTNPDNHATGPTPTTAPRWSASPGSTLASATAPPGDAASELPVERGLSVDAGAVVARCQDATVYLTSWSPAQGYQVESVRRGPASSATVVFTSSGNRVAVSAACADGVPTLTSGDEGNGPEH